MKLPEKKKVNYLALAFAFPFLGMLFVMLISQYEPFGNYAILYSDMYHQYYPFFVEFRRALRSGESLLYSWSVGLGMDYLGLIAYYLASPLNLLSVLVPEGILLEFFSLLTPVRLGLAGLFFALFLKKHFGQNDLSISVFGTCYALCAWALGYLWNIMWMDTFALLPLVALGTVSLLRDKKFILYTASLFLAVFSNYYIGFFVCIFVFLLFWIYEICHWRGFKRFFGDLLRIAAFSLLAIGMTAILELPAFAALQTTQSSVNKFPEGFRLNIADEHTWKGLLDGMRQVAGNMAGGTVHTFKEGLPNIYCGTSAAFLAFLYLTSREIKLRDKICAVLLLVFFALSFLLRQLDYIWHGFHFPNMIPYRFSFLYSFVVLYMAYRAWLLRSSFRLWQILVALLLSLGMLWCSNQCRDLTLFEDGEMGQSWLFVGINALTLIGFVACLCYGRIKARKIPEEAENREEILHYRANVSAVLLTVMAAELVLNLVNFGINFTGTSVSSYPRGTYHAASMIRYMHEREEDNLFFRAEMTHSQTLNDGALNGYNGVSAFTSSANVKVTEFMQVLGYGAKNTYNRYCYEEASPVSNLFLNLKYMIERNGDNKNSTYFTHLHQYGDVALLENNYHLPLGFLAEEELEHVDFALGQNGFRFQNVLMQGATGVPEGVWRLMVGEDFAIDAVDVTVTDQDGKGFCSYEDGLKGATITYTFTVPEDGFFCVELNFPKRNNVSLWKNGEQLYSETMTLQQMLAVGDVTAGDEVQIKATCKNSDESGTLTVRGAVLNRELFEQCYEILSASQLELTEFSTTYVAGTIDSDRDGLLYTSIPQNGNWQVKVDGEEVESTTVGNAMVAVKLSEGEHEVEFEYRNKAFSLGWKISLLCAGIFALLIYREKKPVSRGGKYERKKEKH